MDSSATIPHLETKPPTKISLDSEIHDVSLDYYGKRIAIASSDSTVKIISALTSKTLASLSGHQGPVWSVSWAHPKFGSVLASCSYDGRVIVWRERNGQWGQECVLGDHKGSVNVVAWGPHELGIILVCGSSDGDISVFTMNGDASGWEGYKITRAHAVGVTCLSWSPVGVSGEAETVRIVSGGCDGLVKVWKNEKGSWVREGESLVMHKGWVRSVAWCPSLGKSVVASGSQDGTVVIWKKKEGGKWEGKVMNNFEVPVWSVSWSSVGNTLSVADGGNNVTLWEEEEEVWNKVKTIES